MLSGKPCSIALHAFCAMHTCPLLDLTFSQDASLATLLQAVQSRNTCHVARQASCAMHICLCFSHIVTLKVYACTAHQTACARLLTSACLLLGLLTCMPYQQPWPRRGIMHGLVYGTLVILQDPHFPAAVHQSPWEVQLQHNSLYSVR